MNKFTKFKAIAVAMALFPAVAGAEVFIKFDDTSGISSDSYDSGKWFIVDSFSFGVEREMKESGEKGGTEDINIGVGELQELTIRRSMDAASPLLAQYSINGYSLGNVEVCVTENGGSPNHCYLRYKLDRCFVKSWSVSGDADDRPTEEVAFYYNKIAFAYAATDDGKTGNWGNTHTMSWDNVSNQPWSDGELALTDNR